MYNHLCSATFSTLKIAVFHLRFVFSEIIFCFISKWTGKVKHSKLLKKNQFCLKRLMISYHSHFTLLILLLLPFRACDASY